jgi:transposase-like protein
MLNGGWNMSSKNHRKVYDGVFKARVVLEVLSGEKTLSEIASKYEIHPHQITQWKKQVMELLPDLLSRKHNKTEKEGEALVDELYKQIGFQKVQIDFLKKNLAKLPSILKKRET